MPLLIYILQKPIYLNTISEVQRLEGQGMAVGKLFKDSIIFFRCQQKLSDF